MPREPVAYPTTSDVLELLASLMQRTVAEARDNVRDMGLLESALARPRNEAAYENAALLRQAASLLWGIIRNHPFVDGNKRMGYVLTQAFLRVNGLSIQATEDARFDFIMAVAQHDGLSIGQVENWLRSNVAPWT